MGITEILTIIFVICKLIGLIDWNWFLVLLPEIIAAAIYLIVLVIYTIITIRIEKACKKAENEFRKKFLN